jgi:DNA-binding MarR family transcriptional regulator
MLIGPASADGGERASYKLTPAGCDVVDRLIAARRERLAEMFSDWPEEKHEEIATILTKLARELVPQRG